MSDENPGMLDKEKMRAMYPTEDEMSHLRLLGTGQVPPLNEEVLDFIEMFWQEAKTEIDARIGGAAWNEKSPVVRAYERYNAGERPQ